MSNETHSILLAVIALFSVIVTTAGTAFCAWLTYRMKRIEKGLNGRMDEMKVLERAVGRAEGVQAAVDGVAKATNIGLEARDLAQVVADTVTPPDHLLKKEKP